jgi:SulP family sulfate permease
VGQGVANTVNGMFGGMGGCAMIGQSMININSGGRGRLSGISAALFLLAFILFASGLIEMIPIAALVGVMFIVVVGTFEWASFRLLGRIPLADTMVGIVVAVVTVLTDLAIAVIVGVIMSALVFAWQHAKHINIQNFHELFDPKNDPQEVVVDFANARVYDHSGLEAIDTLAERFARAQKTLHLRHLSAECKTLMDKAGSLVEVNLIEDPNYHVADDRLA